MSASARLALIAVVIVGMGRSAPAQEPTTSRDAVKMLDLRSLPRLDVDREFVVKPTVISYFAHASVAGGMAFYNAELKGQGWTETRGVVSAPDTKDYADHTYEKNGSRLRPPRDSRWRTATACPCPPKRPRDRPNLRRSARAWRFTHRPT